MANETTVVEVNYTRRGTSGTVYFAAESITTGPSDTPANTTIEGRIVSRVVVRERINSAVWGAGSSDISISAIDLANPDGGIDFLLDGEIRDQLIRVYRIGYGDALSSGTRVATVLGERVDVVNDTTARLVTVGALSRLSVPLRGALYNGSQAASDLTGKPKPIAIGKPSNARPVVIDGPNLDYQIHDGPLEAVTDVKDRGAALTVTTEYTADTDAGTVALVSSPSGQITITPDTGEELAADFWSALLRHGGLKDSEIGGSGTSVIASEFSAEFSYHYHPEDGRITVGQVAELMAASVAGWVVPDEDGVLNCYPLAQFTQSYGHGSLVEIHVDECGGQIRRTFDRAPGLVSSLGVDPNWHPHSDGTIAGVVAEETGQLLSQSHLETVAATDHERLAPEYRHALEAAPRPTLLMNTAAAQSVIDYEVGLYAEPRYFWSVPDVLDASTAAGVRVGVTRAIITGGRLGLDTGVPMLVAGVDRDLDRETVSLTLWGSAGRYVTEVTDFPGSNDYFDANAVSMGMSDSSSATVCLAVRIDGTGAQTFIMDGNQYFGVRIDSAGRLNVQAKSGGGSTLVSWTGTTDLRDFDDWISILISVDTSDDVVAYINDRLEKANSSTISSGSIDFSRAEWRIGERPSGIEDFNGALCHLGILSGTAIDLSDRANRRLFFDDLHRPVDAGSDGAAAFGGSAPQIWIPDGNAADNRGSGGDFTKSGGASTTGYGPTDIRSFPELRRFNQEAHNFDTTDGAANYSSKSGVSDDKQFTFCACFRTDGTPFLNQLFWINSTRVSVATNASGELRIRCDNSSGTKLIGLRGTAALSSATWYAVLVSIDVEAGTWRVYVNDEPHPMTLDASIVNSNIDFSVMSLSYYVGERSGAGYSLDGDICHVGLLVGTALEIDKPAVRRRFFDRYHRPVYAGSDGSIAFGGTTPTIWIPDGKVAGSPPLSDEYPTDYRLGVLS